MPREAEAGIAGGNDEIATHGDLAAGTNHLPLHKCDHRDVYSARSWKGGKGSEATSPDPGYIVTLAFL
jgi:hypothetical protein